MTKIEKIIIITSISLLLQSCKLWPYRSDFDCPIPDGLQCKSLYEVNELVDSGMFDEKIINDKKTNNPRCHCRKIKNWGSNANT